LWLGKRRLEQLEAECWKKTEGTGKNIENISRKRVITGNSNLNAGGGSRTKGGKKGTG